MPTNAPEDEVWVVPEGFYTNPEVIARLIEKQAKEIKKASPQIFTSENFSPDRRAKTVTEQTSRKNLGKAELSHLLEFADALDELSEVCRKGAMKYTRGNWKLGGPNTTTESFYDAALRHMKKRMKGELRDDELNTLHSAQAAWNLLADTYHTLRREEDAEAKD